MTLTNNNMQDLIQKAISAIEEGKTERAIGLLEGALAIAAKSDNTYPLSAYGGNQTPSLPGLTAQSVQVSGDTERDLLEAQARGSLETIKRLADESSN